MSYTEQVLMLVLVSLIIWCGTIEGQGIRVYDYVLRESSFTRLCNTKNMMVVNGSFPGPLLEVEEGDTVFVNFYNEASENVTIHWHGVKMPRSPWWDGPNYITQCPIQPRSNFTYQIYFSDEIGTLWWHAHSDWGRATVHGAIAIRPRNGSSYAFGRYDADPVMLLASWFNANVTDVIEEALRTGGEPNVSDAYTINGQPGDLYECSNASTFRMTVYPGRTYLLRLVNAVLNEDMFFGIARHNLTVVAIDAAYVRPINTNHIMISPGQAMDVLVTADQAVNRYYIAGSPYKPGVAPFDNSVTTAIFEYAGASSSTPILPDIPAYNDTSTATNFTAQFRSLPTPDHPVNVPQRVKSAILITVSINLLNCEANNTCEGPNGTRLSASLNNMSFVTPSEAILYDYSNQTRQRKIFKRNFPRQPPRFFNFTANTTTPDTLIPARETSARSVLYNESVEVIWQGTAVASNPDIHPMHLHGYSFYVVGTGEGNFASSHRANFNLVDPPLLNTVAVPVSGWVAVRFFADNPGVWFMHCHIEKHASWGMATVLIVANGPTPATQMRPRPAYVPPCF